MGLDLCKLLCDKLYLDLHISSQEGIGTTLWIVFPISSMMYGEYGISDVALSMPAILGKNGVETKVPIPLSTQELAKLKESASMLRDILDDVGM